LGLPHISSGRDLLIKIGDGFRNKFYKDIWIDAWKKSIINSGADKIVVSDCRYLNEVFKILEETSYSSKFYFCNYSSDRYRILDNESEWLAQQLIDIYKDGDEIDPKVFFELYTRSPT